MFFMVRIDVIIDSFINIFKNQRSHIFYKAKPEFLYVHSIYLNLGRNNCYYKDFNINFFSLNESDLKFYFNKKLLKLINNQIE